MKTLEQNIFFATKAHQVLIAVGLDKRVVVDLVVNVALDSPGVGFHLQKQHILLIILKSFAAQSLFGPFFLGLLPTTAVRRHCTDWYEI